MADKEEEKEAKPSGGLLPIINLVLLVLVLAVGGFIAWTMLQMDQQPAQEATEPVQVEETAIPEAEDEDPDALPVFMDIEDITVNLADVEERRFLRAKIKLEVRSEEAKARIDANIPKVKDLLISMLGSKKFDEIRTPQGKYELKRDLVYRMNELVGGKPIKNLYFTDFVSQ